MKNKLLPTVVVASAFVGLATAQNLQSGGTEQYAGAAYWNHFLGHFNSVWGITYDTDVDGFGIVGQNLDMGLYDPVWAGYTMTMEVVD